MAEKITDETIEYVSILAKLKPSEEEKIQARKDMQQMLDYIDKCVSGRYRNQRGRQGEHAPQRAGGKRRTVCCAYHH